MKKGCGVWVCEGKPSFDEARESALRKLTAKDKRDQTSCRASSAMRKKQGRSCEKSLYRDE